MRKTFAGVLIVLFLSVIGVLLFWKPVLYRVGTFLVVNEKAGKVDAVVAAGISPKVVRCYKKGDCKRIFIFIPDFSNYWKAMRNIDNEKIALDKAKAEGIDPDDLVLLTGGPGSSVQQARYFESLFVKEKIQSAVFYFSYFQTRRQRFYLDRFFTNKDIAVYVQPGTDDYESKFDNWWENTVLDNLFALEFARMAYYYFNRFLWSPIL